MAEEWNTGGVVVNPILGAVLIDTGALPESRRQFSVIVASTVPALTFLEHRDAANAVTLHRLPLFCVANGTVDEAIPTEVAFPMADSERLRVVAGALTVGSLMGTVFINGIPAPFLGKQAATGAGAAQRPGERAIGLTAEDLAEYARLSRGLLPWWKRWLL